MNNNTIYVRNDEAVELGNIIQRYWGFLDGSEQQPDTDNFSQYFSSWGLTEDDVKELWEDLFGEDELWDTDEDEED